MWLAAFLYKTEYMCVHVIWEWMVYSWPDYFGTHLESALLAKFYVDEI